MTIRFPAITAWLKEGLNRKDSGEESPESDRNVPRNKVRVEASCSSNKSRGGEVELLLRGYQAQEEEQGPAMPFMGPYINDLKT